MCWTVGLLVFDLGRDRNYLVRLDRQCFRTAAQYADQLRNHWEPAVQARRHPCSAALGA